MAREPAPLETVEGDDGDVLYTWRHLLTFCVANPKLTTTAVVLDRYRELFGQALTSQGGHEPPPRTVLPAAAATSDKAALDESILGNGATLRSAVAELRTEVEAHASLALAAVRLADDAARIQRGLLDRLRVLEAAAGPN